MKEIFQNITWQTVLAQHTPVAPRFASSRHLHWKKASSLAWRGLSLRQFCDILSCFRYIILAVPASGIYISERLEILQSIPNMQLTKIFFLASLITASLAHTRVWSIWVNDVDQGPGVSTYVCIISISIYMLTSYLGDPYILGRFGLLRRTTPSRT